MTYCSNCGMELPEGAKFCSNCGKPVASAAPPVGYTTKAEEVPQAPKKDTYLESFKPIPPAPDLPFRLQDGEVILKEFKPSKKVVIKFAIGTIILAFFLLITLGPALILPLFISHAAALWAAALIIFTLIVLIVVAGVVYGLLAYSKYSYWITNHRSIGRRGVIGFTLDSMPLENVADVIISRSILDRILGISSIYVQPIGGGMVLPIRGTGFNRYQGSNTFIGIDPSSAPEIQQLIFHLRDLRKRETGRIL